METSPRGNGGKFMKKKAPNSGSTLPNSLDMLATIALASDNSHSSLELSYVTPKKRRRSDMEQLNNNNVVSERLSEVSLKNDGVHFTLARGISHGEPFKRFKRAMNASMSRKMIRFVINDDGDMFESTDDVRRRRDEDDGCRCQGRRHPPSL